MLGMSSKQVRVCVQCEKIFHGYNESLKKKQRQKKKTADLDSSVLHKNRLSDLANRMSEMPSQV